MPMLVVLGDNLLLLGKERDTKIGNIVYGRYLQEQFTCIILCSIVPLVLVVNILEKGRSSICLFI